MSNPDGYEKKDKEKESGLARWRARGLTEEPEVHVGGW